MRIKSLLCAGAAFFSPRAVLGGDLAIRGAISGGIRDLGKSSKTGKTGKSPTESEEEPRFNGVIHGAFCSNVVSDETDGSVRGTLKVTFYYVDKIWKLIQASPGTGVVEDVNAKVFADFFGDDSQEHNTAIVAGGAVYVVSGTAFKYETGNTFSMAWTQTGDQANLPAPAVQEFGIPCTVIVGVGGGNCACANGGVASGSTGDCACDCTGTGFDGDNCSHLTGPPGVVVVPLQHGSMTTSQYSDSNLNDLICAKVLAEIEIGSPAQTVLVVFDTGSTSLAAPPIDLTANGGVCEMCEDPTVFGDEMCELPQCGPDVLSTDGACVRGGYDPTASTTVSYLPSTDPDCGSISRDTSTNDRCQVAQGYTSVAGRADGCDYGWQGDAATDTVTIGGKSATNVTLVPITTLQQHNQIIQAQAPGIWGASLNYIMPNTFGPVNCGVGDRLCTKQPAPMEVFLTNAGLPDEFSVCMGTATAPGALVLGGIDPHYYDGAFMTADILEPYRAYTVMVTDVYVGKQAYSALPGTGVDGQYTQHPALVDTGDPLMFLAAEYYDAFFPSDLVGVSDLVCTTDDDCMLGLVIEAAGGGVPFNLTVPGVVTCNENSRCYPTHTYGGGILGDSLLGDLLQKGGGKHTIGFAGMRGYYTHFDLDKKTIGFAAASAACTAVQQEPF